MSLANLQQVRSTRALETAISEGHLEKSRVQAYFRAITSPGHQPQLEDYQVSIISAGLESFGDAQMQVARIFSRDREYDAIIRIAKEISLSRVTVQDYVARATYYGLNLEQCHDFASGTLLLAHAYKSLREEAMEYGASGPDCDYIREGVAGRGPASEGAQQQTAADVPAVIRLPPTIIHHHAEQQDYAVMKGMEVVHNAYPALTKEWEELLHTWIANPSVKILPSTGGAAKVVTQKLNYATVRVSHAEYGWDGVSRNRTKPDCNVTQLPTPVFSKPTHSTAVTEHHPVFLPRYDRKSRLNACHGLTQRLNREPKSSLYDLNAMRPYIKKAVKHLIARLEAAGLRPNPVALTPRTFIQWLATRKFPSAKKIKYLRDVRPYVIDENTWVSADLFPIDPGAFLKNEGLPAGNKGPRMILPGPYAMAAVMGPLCDIIGDYFFSLPYTSKKIPETERPKVALLRFGKAPVILNDMSAFECSITAEHQDMIEHAVFKHFFPAAAPWVDRYKERISISQPGYNAELPSLRRSGDPQTSLGNSITNLVSIMAARFFVADKMHDGVCAAPVAWVEGDDSLVAWPGTWGEVSEENTSFMAYLRAFRIMGFDTKMEIKGFAGDAGYCSMFFTERGKNSPSVAQTIIDFPYDHNNTGQGIELLAMKAQSIMSQAPGQPITCAVAARFTPDAEPLTYVMPFNAYEYEEMVREGFDVCLNKSTMTVRLWPRKVPQPDEEDRELFARRYGLTAAEQIDIERRILRKGLLGISAAELARLAKVDGIDLESCRRFYQQHAEKSDVFPRPDNEPIVRHFAQGPDGSWLMNEERLPPVVEDAPSVQAGSVRAIVRNPYTHRMRRAVEVREKIKSETKKEDVRSAVVAGNWTRTRAIVSRVTDPVGTIRDLYEGWHLRRLDAGGGGRL